MKDLTLGDNCLNIDLDVTSASKRIKTNNESMIYIRTHTKAGLVDGFQVHSGDENTIKDALTILITQDPEMLAYSLDVLIEFFKEDEARLGAFRTYLSEVGI